MHALTRIQARTSLPVLLAVLAGCGDERLAAAWGHTATTGVAAQGKTLIRHYGCGACHEIPGIPGANGIVGPPLAHLAARGYLGGIVANTPDNLVHWLMDPPAVDPSTAMPSLGLSESEARHMAAYLYTLE